MRVLINGEPKELSEIIRLSELLQRLDLPSQRIAVEINKTVIRRKDWENTDVNDGDRIEVVHFVGGG